MESKTPDAIPDPPEVPPPSSQGFKGETYSHPDADLQFEISASVVDASGNIVSNLEKTKVVRCHRRAYVCLFSGEVIELVCQHRIQNTDGLKIHLALHEYQTDTHICDAFIDCKEAQEETVPDKIKHHGKKPGTYIDKSILCEYSYKEKSQEDQIIKLGWSCGAIGLRLNAKNLPPVALRQKQNAKPGILNTSYLPETKTSLILSPRSFKKTNQVAPNSSTLVRFKLKMRKVTQQLSVSNEKQTVDIDVRAANVAQTRRAFKMGVAAFILFIILGLIVFPFVEGWTPLQAVYFSVTTLTTIGYGDISPTTTGGRIFAVIYVLFGVAIIGAAIGIVSEYMVKVRNLAAAEAKAEARKAALAEDEDSSDEDSSEDENSEPLVGASSGMERASNQIRSFPIKCCNSPRSQAICSAFVKDFLPFILVNALGMIVMISVEGLSFVDALYWGVVTGTTVGYGDISPKTDGTMIFFLIYGFLAIYSCGKLLGAIGSLLVSSGDHDSTTRLLSRKLDADFLKSIDRDGDGQVSEFEYLSAMLVRMEYAALDDIDKVMKSFRKLDRDGSGTLEVEDLIGNLKSNRMKARNQKGEDFLQRKRDLKERRRAKAIAGMEALDSTANSSVSLVDNHGQSEVGP